MSGLLIVRNEMTKARGSQGWTACGERDERSGPPDIDKVVKYPQS